jgi:hypothetical protein
MRAANGGDVENAEIDDLEFDPDFFPVHDDEEISGDFLYIVKKSLIMEEWKKRKLQKAKYEKRKELEKSKNKGGSAL